MYDAVQILGSLLILAAFVLALAGKVSQRGYGYLVANVLGSAVLTATAVIDRQWGFILLEGVWSLASLATIARRAAGQAH